jgi:hypothetical protein
LVSESVIKIIKSYISELIEKGLSFEKVYLYGSHAKNSASLNSDIDLMLVSNLFNNDKDSYLPIIWLSNIRTENRIEPYMMGTNHFYNEFSPLADAVKLEGIEIPIH